METHIQYPSLTFNQILLGILDKYKIKKVSFINKNFNIKLEGKRLLNCKLTYIDLNDKNIEIYFRVYGTKNSMPLLYSKDIS